jgi:Domain of unknown function (DUF1127)
MDNSYLQVEVTVNSGRVSAIELPATRLRRGAARVVDGIADGVARLILRRAVNAAYAELSTLDDRVLADLGIDRPAIVKFLLEVELHARVPTRI